MKLRRFPTVDRDLVQYLLSEGQAKYAVELANLWAEIGYWNSRKERFSAGAYSRTWGTSEKRVHSLIERLEALRGCTRKGPQHWPQITALPMPWNAETPPETPDVLGGHSGSGSVSESVSVSESKKQPSAKGLTPQQEETLLKIWNSQAGGKSYLQRHQKITADTVKPISKWVKQYPGVDLGAAVGAYLVKSERWMQQRFQETQRVFSLRAVLQFPTFGDHLDAFAGASDQGSDKPDTLALDLSKYDPNHWSRNGKKPALRDWLYPIAPHELGHQETIVNGELQSKPRLVSNGSVERVHTVEEALAYYADWFDE